MSHAGTRRHAREQDIITAWLAARLRLTVFIRFDRFTLKEIMKSKIKKGRIHVLFISDVCWNGFLFRVIFSYISQPNTVDYEHAQSARTSHRSQFLFMNVAWIWGCEISDGVLWKFARDVTMNATKSLCPCCLLTSRVGALLALAAPYPAEWVQLREGGRKRNHSSLYFHR